MSLVVNSGFTITAPTMAPTDAGVNYNPGGLTPGANYQYCVTFVTGFGETTVGPASLAIVASASGAIAINRIETCADENVIARKLYRTIAGGTSFFLLATLDNNTATTYLDLIPDAGLGAAVPVANTASSRQITMGSMSFSAPVAASTAPSITAHPGGGQASAVELISEYNFVTVVGSAGDSVRLPLLSVDHVGMRVTVVNYGGADLAVFPAVDQDLGLGVNAAYSLRPGASVTFIATDATAWAQMPDAALGTVTGPGSSTTAAIARWLGTSGTVLANSTVTVSDVGDVAAANSLQFAAIAANPGGATTLWLNSSGNIIYYGSRVYSPVYWAGSTIRIGPDVGSTASGSIICAPRGAPTLTDAGSYNVVVGTDAGYALTNGQTNVLVGLLAGGSLTTGSLHTLLGGYAGRSMTTDTGNICVGYSAGVNTGGNYNVFIGVNAGAGVAGQTTAENVSIGYSSGNALVTGSTRNCMVGNLSGSHVTTGTNNSFLGYSTGFNLTTGSYNIYIGDSVDGAAVTESRTTRIGAVAQTAAYVGGVYGAAASVSSDPGLVYCNSDGKMWSVLLGDTVPMGTYYFAGGYLRTLVLNTPTLLSMVFTRSWSTTALLDAVTTPGIIHWAGVQPASITVTVNIEGVTGANAGDTIRFEIHQGITALQYARITIASLTSRHSCAISAMVGMTNATSSDISVYAVNETSGNSITIDTITFTVIGAPYPFHA